MFPAPGRPPTRHLSGRTARDAVGFSRRGGFVVSVLHHTAISPVGSPHSVGHYMQDSAQRAAHTSYICVVFAPLPARPRSKGSVLRGLHSGTQDWIIEVPLASPAATCSNLDALKVRLNMLMSSAALRAPGVPQHGYTSRFLRVTACRSASVAAMRGDPVRCTLGMLRSGDTPASTRNSLAGQGTREPGPAETGLRTGGGLRALTAQGHNVLWGVCVANRPQPLAPGRTRHCPLPPTK